MKQLRKDWVIMLLACYAAGFLMSLSLFWPDQGHQTRFQFVLVMVLSPLVLGALLFVPIGTFIVGLIRIRRAREEAAKLDDSLADVPPEVAEQRLREFVALKQGLGARIGMGERVQMLDVANATYTLPEDDPRGLPRVQP